MFYLKKIYQAAIRQKTSSLMSVFSLTICFIGVISLYLIIRFEKSFEQFHENKNVIYRLETSPYGSHVPAILGRTAADNVPEIEQLTIIQFRWHDGTMISQNEADNQDINATVLVADNSFFDLFSFPLIKGDPRSVLLNPGSIVLTSSLSEKLFGHENPLGKTLIIEGIPLLVTGLMQDFPQNSSFQAEAIVSFATIKKPGLMAENQWEEWSFNVFLKLSASSDYLSVAERIDKLPEIEEGIRRLKETHPGQQIMALTPLTGIHFKKDASVYYAYTNPLVIKTLYILGFILIVMGMVNFINFTTSQAPARARTLAIMEVMGGRRSASRTMIALEAILLSIIALALAIVVNEMIYGFLQDSFQVFELRFIGHRENLLYGLLFALIFGILAAIHPSRYITAPPLTDTIKGTAYFRGKGKTLRSILLCLQFTFVITLLIASITIEKQLSFWRNFDMGIDREYVMYMPLSEKMKLHHNSLVHELTKSPLILDYSISQYIPGAVHMAWGRQLNNKYIPRIISWPVDDRFIDFFGIKISEGRAFSPGSEMDKNTFIINQKAQEIIGWENPLGQRIEGFGFMGEVIGVVENFHFSSLKEEIEPMIFWYTDTWKDVIMFRLSIENMEQAIGHIKKTARLIDPASPAEVKFLQDSLYASYKKEENMALLVKLISLWSMLLAFTGLSGMVYFVCLDRKKEIGLRKVNGAKTHEIMLQLNIGFARWVGLSFIIAAPLGWYLMQQWLSNFAFRTSLSWWIFAMAGLTALLLTIITASIQTWKTASSNPIEAIRYE